MNQEVVSHHFFRRTARARARRLNRLAGGALGAAYHVVPARRGPWRWLVVR